MKVDSKIKVGIKDMAIPRNCKECQFSQFVGGAPDYDYLCSLDSSIRFEDTDKMFIEKRHDNCRLVGIDL